MDTMLYSLSKWMPELLRTSLQAALLVAVIVAVQWAFAKRLSPGWRHALWGLLVVRLLMVWAPASPLSVYNLAPREVPVLQAPAEPMHTEIAAVSTASMPGEVAPATQTRGGRDISDGMERSAWGNLDFRAAASLVWLGVFGALLFAMTGQSLHFGRQVRRGRIVTDSGTLELLEECRATLRVSPYLALVETDCVRSPALLGCVRPKLLLPGGFLNALSREEMRHVFLHELAHVKRGDIWSGWLFNLLLAAHWFNPAIWFARRRFIADREAACDAHVLAALDTTGQQGYGHTVLNLTQRFNASPWAPGMAGISETNSNLKRRITMIKQFRPPTRLAAWSGAGLCVCIGLATLTNAQDVKTAGDIVCEISDVYGYTATNGGTMIAAQLTNTGTQDVTVDVEFWEGGIDTGTKIGRGGLVVPARKTATEAIPWAVENGRHSVAVQIDPDNVIAEADEDNNRVLAVIHYKDGRFTEEPAPDASHQESEASGSRRTGGMRTGDEIARKADADDTAGNSAAEFRAQCQNNMKQLGLVFKMFANESEGQRWPVLSREPGRLMFAWGGNEPTLDGMAVLSHEYMTELSIAVCPNTEGAPEVPDDTDYVYLGHVVRGDEDVRHFAEAYRNWAVRSGVGSKVWFTDDIQLPLQERREAPGPNSLFRIREGIERFYITDINDPASGSRQQSYTPVLIEWPDRHRSSSGQQVGNVLFMDGHVEFMTYPGKWPMTEETIGILCKLAGREPIKITE